MEFGFLIGPRFCIGCLRSEESEMQAVTVRVPTIPVEGGTMFPVRRIWCVGQNCADRAREMGGDPDRMPAFFLAKHADAVVPGGGTLDFPVRTEALHREVGVTSRSARS